MKTFKLVRTVDVTGVSGTGVVAEGAELVGGKCVLSWLTDPTSIAVYDNIADLIAIHGHQGASQIVWDPQTQRQR